MDVRFVGPARGEANTGSRVSFWVDDGLLERVRRATGGEGVSDAGGGDTGGPNMEQAVQEMGERSSITH